MISLVASERLYYWGATRVFLCENTIVTESIIITIEKICFS